MALLKNRTDIQALMHAGKTAGKICDELLQAAQPGISTMALEQLANRLLQLSRSTAPFKSFHGFGHAICVSLNDEIVNGPPSRDRTIQEGDLVSIAVGTCINGMHGKAARSNYLGVPTADIQRLLKGTQETFAQVTAKSMQTNSLRSLLEEIAAVAEAYQLSVIKDSGGCFIGRQLHEAPSVPNLAKELAEDVQLSAGMAFTLMPMMALGGGDYVVHEDGWTQVTADGSLSAHFAETMFMTDEGLIIIS